MGWVALGGAALGAINNVEKQKQAKKDREREAVLARYSPWTGMQAHPVESPSAFNDVLQGATMGAALGQNMKSADSAEAMNAKQGGLVDAQTAYYQNLAQQQSPPADGSAGSMGAQPVQKPWMTWDTQMGPNRK